MAESTDLGALDFLTALMAIQMEQPMQTTKGDTIFGENERINKRVVLIEAQYTLELHLLSGEIRIWHF